MLSDVFCYTITEINILLEKVDLRKTQKSLTSAVTVMTRSYANFQRCRVKNDKDSKKAHIKKKTQVQ